MTADESLAAIRLKIERARDHLRDLQDQVGTFLATKPYEVGAKRDPSTRKPIYFVARITTTPAMLPAIAGDVLQNLRSALDHLAYRLEVVGLGRAPSDPRYIAYPIGDVEAEYPPRRNQTIKAARQEAKDAIDATKPYRVAGLGMARTFQNIRLFKALTALENVKIAAHLRTRAGLAASIFRPIRS